jgi:hypothetical protein
VRRPQVPEFLAVPACKADPATIVACHEVEAGPSILFSKSEAPLTEDHPADAVHVLEREIGIPIRAGSKLNALGQDSFCFHTCEPPEPQASPSKVYREHDRQREGE